MAQETRGLSSEAVVRPPAVEVYAFGPVVVDVARHVVTRDGQPIALAPKTFELLLVLVRSGGRALSRQELVSALWPDTFVEEANLSFQISTLRKALGAGAEQWIETVPKVGYRFTREATPEPAGVATERPTGDSRPGPAGHLASIAQALPSAHPLDTQPTTGPLSRTHLRLSLGRMVLATLGAAALAAGALTVAALAGRVGDRTDANVRAISALLDPRALPDPTASRLGASATPLTSYFGSETSPSLSPDGSQVAFAWDGAKLNYWDLDVYRTSVSGGEPVRMTSTPQRESSPAWSPDGEQIAYLRTNGDMHDLMVMPALGGPARSIKAGIRLFNGWGYGGLLAWTPDGRWLAVGTQVDGVRGIWLFAADGSARRRLTTGRDWAPRFASDGRRMAFIRELPPKGGQLLMIVLDATQEPGGTPITLVDGSHRMMLGAAWEPGDRAMIYSAGSLARSWLFRIALQHDRLAPEVRTGRLTTFGDGAIGLDIAASGRLVYVKEFRDSGLWRLDLSEPARGLSDAGVPASPLDELAPQYSPDGRQVTFASTRSAAQEIWVSDVDGSHARRVTFTGGGVKSYPRWSPDGRRIVFCSTQAKTRDLYLLDLATLDVQQLTSLAGDEMHPRWSRDGRRIYYSVSDQDGDQPADSEIWKIASDGGAPTQVTVGGGTAAEESYDGKWIFFTRQERSAFATLWRVPSTGGAAVRFADDLVSPAGFAVGRRAVYVIARGTVFGESAFDALDLATAARTRLYTFDKRWFPGAAPRSDDRSELALSPDERSLLVSMVNSQGKDLMLMEPAR